MESEGGGPRKKRQRRGAGRARARRAGESAPSRRPRADPPVPGMPCCGCAPTRSSGSTTIWPASRNKMAHLMRDAHGVGLAATQVGVLQRLFVFQARGRGGRHGDRQPGDHQAARRRPVADEGCLSLQGVLVPVERARRRDGRGAGRHRRAASARARRDGRARRPARDRPPRRRADARAHDRRGAPRGARHAAAAARHST